MARKPKFPPGTWIERDLFEGEAFWALSGSAAKVLIILLGKRHFTTVGRKGKQRRVCDNCEELTFTYAEAEKKFGITQPRFTRAIDDLLAKGFIEIVHPGGAYKRDRTVYALREKWRIWEPGKVMYKRPRDVHRGFQGRKAAMGSKAQAIQGE